MSHSCSLYDTWLQMYNRTNTTLSQFEVEMDASNINGFKVPGMSFMNFSFSYFWNPLFNPCLLDDKWILRYSTIFVGQRLAFSSGASSFENILGISSIDITVKNRHSATGDGYPYEASSLDNANNAKTFLKFDHAKIITKVCFNYITEQSCYY